MKKHVLLATGLVLASTSAFATTARMSAMGHGADGSRYMADTRNVWHNPAHVNSMNNYVVTDWDGSAGISRAGGNLNYGLYFNDGTHGNLNGGAAGGVTPARLDLFVGGSAGMDWGVRLGYDSWSSGDNGGSAFDLGFGVNLNSGMSVWANLAPGSSEKDALGAESKYGMDMAVGASMPLMGWTASLDYSSDKGADASDDDDQTTITVEMGRVMEAGSGARWFTDVSLAIANGDGTSTDNKQTSIPVTFGFEADANSWLTWRGSASQSIYGERDTAGTKSSASTFAVNAGATLNFGKLKIDGTLTTGTGSTVDASNFMGSVDAHYWF